ncbi:FAD-dependent oxidoreductase [Dokdonella sp.]|uniref:NAD(P)/FAD-dependent oxidoreductase n=1 Tax=Dokdonella sp. TaxID=2291710 RepID=UPI002F42E3A7
MDLKSGYPFWTVRSGLIDPFPALEGSVECDVAVVGAGITGALIGRRLQRDGHRVVLIDRRECGWGSTAASTALLQYELDVEMVDLAARHGDAAAALAYRASAGAVQALSVELARFRRIGFRRARSLYFATRAAHRRRLIAEWERRRDVGLRVDWLESDALRRAFGIDAAAAILTRPAAEVDPYRACHALLRAIVRDGGAVFDRTAMSGFAVRSRDIRVETDRGASVRARHLVIAAGYESQRWLDARVARNRSSYAFVTDARDDLARLRGVLAWETARPYLYMRTTDDGRLLVGGADDRIDLPIVRSARVAAKAAKLAREAERRIGVSIEPAWAWGGTFAETEDGLPFFDAHAQYGPRVLFALAYGGNGIAYARLGADVLAARVRGRAHACDRLVSFARLDRRARVDVQPAR